MTDVIARLTEEAKTASLQAKMAIARQMELEKALEATLPFFNNHRHYERGERVYQMVLSALRRNGQIVNGTCTYGGCTLSMGHTGTHNGNAA